jgi:MFS family permease
VLFFTGTAIAGVGFGSGFQGSIRLVVPLVGERDRAGVLSALYVVVYLGLGVPAVIGGVLVTEVNGLLATAREYGSAVAVLAALALAGLLLHSPPKPPAGRWRTAPPPPADGRAARSGTDAGPHRVTAKPPCPRSSPRRPPPASTSSP